MTNQEIKSKCTCDINGAEDDIGHFAGCPADTLSQPADTSASNRTCPQCKQSLDTSAFGWDKENKVCNGCSAFNEKEITPSGVEKKCEMCKDVDDLAPSMSYCAEHKYSNPPSDQKDWREELADLSEKHCKHDDNELYSCLYHIFEPFISKVEAEAEERGKAEIKQKWDGDKFVYYRDRVRFAINEARHELLERIKNTPTEKAHTYASENSEIYRAYDAGQENYKQKILSLLNQEKEDKN